MDDYHHIYYINSHRDRCIKKLKKETPLQEF